MHNFKFLSIVVQGNFFFSILLMQRNIYVSETLNSYFK